jgi:hypothetical protein
MAKRPQHAAPQHSAQEVSGPRHAAGARAAWSALRTGLLAHQQPTHPYAVSAPIGKVLQYIDPDIDICQMLNHISGGASAAGSCSIGGRGSSSSR